MKLCNICSIIMNGLSGDPPPRELKQTGATFIRSCWVVENKSEWMDNNRRFCLHMQSPSAVFRFFSENANTTHPGNAGPWGIFRKTAQDIWFGNDSNKSWLILVWGNQFWRFMVDHFVLYFLCYPIYPIYIYIWICVCVLCYPINQSSKQASEQSINQASERASNQSINQYIYIYIHRYTYVYIYIYNYIHIPGITGNYHDKWWTGTGWDFSVAKKRRMFNQHRAGAGCWWTPLMKTGAWRTKWVWVKMEGLWPMEPQMLDRYIYI